MSSKTKHSTSIMNIVIGSIVIVVGYRLVKDYLDNRDHDLKKDGQTNENSDNVDENQQILDEQRGQIEDNQEQIEENKEAINELKDQLNKKFPVGVYIILGVLLAIVIIIFFVKPPFLKELLNKLKLRKKYRDYDEYYFNYHYIQNNGEYDNDVNYPENSVNDVLLSSTARTQPDVFEKIKNFTKKHGQKKNE